MEHERFMRQALSLAQHAEGRTWPNPLVGCVLVKDGKIIIIDEFTGRTMPGRDDEHLAASAASLRPHPPPCGSHRSVGPASHLGYAAAAHLTFSWPAAAVAAAPSTIWSWATTHSHILLARLRSCV